jgi:hypothetical protein
MLENCWEIEGPGRGYDFYVFPGDTEEQHQTVREFFLSWAEELWDQTEVGQPAMSVSIRLRKATDEDRKMLAGEVE